MRKTIALLPLLLSAAVQAQDLPLYKLTPGQHITFTSTFRSSGAYASESTSTAQYIVLRKNSDGTHRLLYHTLSKSKYGDSPADESSALVLFDLSDKGEISNATQSFSADPAANLPRLPTTATEATNGYSTTDKYGDNSDFKLLTEPSDPKPRIEITAAGVMSKIYGVSQITVWTFDAATGLPLKADSLSSQTFGTQSSGRGTIDRKSIDTLPEADLAKLTSEAEIYTAANESYIAAIRSGETDPNASSNARKILTDAEAKITHPLLLADLAAKIKQHDSSARYYTDSAKERAAILNKPAFDFSTTDLAGNPHTLADYKGKVVVLDFWYRGCGWCIRAMPQVKQLAEDFKNEPVAVLGMNTDQKEEDAAFVIKTLDLTYPTLKATGLPEKYAVRGFPTLLIIDQQGTLRDLHVGYSPDLRTTVANSIRKLLAETNPGR